MSCQNATAFHHEEHEVLEGSTFSRQAAKDAKGRIKAYTMKSVKGSMKVPFLVFLVILKSLTAFMVAVVEAVLL